MAASANDKFLYVGNPGTATTLSAPGYTIGNATINVASTTNFPTLTGVVFAIDVAEVVDGEEVRVDGSYCVFAGVVTSATAIGSLSLLSGTPQDYAAGALTRVYITVSALHNKRLIEGLTAQHSQLDGSHTAITATSLASSGAITGTTITGTSLVSSGDIQHRSISLETIRNDLVFDFVASGCVWSGDSYGGSRNASMTAGVVYIGGKRVAVALVTARSFTASKDTYVDVDNAGTLTYTEVANNAASPALAANSIRLGIIVTGATTIANAGSVNQGQENMILPAASSIAYSVTDSLGNLICPRDPNRKILGYRQITSQINATTIAQVTGLTVPVIVPTGRKIEVTAWTYSLENNTLNQYAEMSVWDGVVNVGTQITAAIVRDAVASMSNTQKAETETTPTSASKTYNVGLSNAGGSGTASVLASATKPAFIRVRLA